MQLSYADQMREQQRLYSEQLQLQAPSSQAHLYVIADCAQDALLGAELEGRSAHIRALTPSVRTGPMFLEILPDETTFEWLFEEAKGRRWFITVLSRYSFDEVWGHGRKFTQVNLHDGRQVAMRYYDPFHMLNQGRAFSVEQRLRFFDKFEFVFAEVGDFMFKVQCESDGSLGWSLMSASQPVDEPSSGVWAPPPFDMEGSAAKPLFMLNKRQYEMPVHSNTPLLLEDLEAYVRADFEWRWQTYPPGIARAMVEAGATAAVRDYAIDDLVCLRQFVDLQWRVAPGFHLQPAINALLKDEELSPAQRFDRLWSERYNDAIAAAFDYDDSRHWRLPFPPSAPQPAR